MQDMMDCWYLYGLITRHACMQVVLAVDGDVAGDAAGGVAGDNPLHIYAGHFGCSLRLLFLDFLLWNWPHV